MGIRKRSLLRIKGGEHYVALDLKDKILTDDLSSCFTFSCTNKRILSKNTGIAYHRLVYLFTKKGKSCIIENNHIIIKGLIHYKGKQPGGIRKGKLFVRGNTD